MRVAEKAMESGDYDVATRFYQSVVDDHPTSTVALLGLGEAAFARGSLDEAEAAFRAAFLLSPDSAETNDALGMVLVSKGAFHEAIEHFSRAVALAPSPSLHNKLGVAYDLMGVGDLAQHHYRAALELDPETVTARNNLALSLAISEQYPEAIAEMERVAALPDATDRHRQNLAFVYGMAGRLDDSSRVLGEEKVSSSRQARNREVFERIRALARAGDRPAVLEFLRNARTGASFADQIDRVPPAPAQPETVMAERSAPTEAVIAARPMPSETAHRLRPDEMAIPTPGTAAEEPPATVSREQGGGTQSRLAGLTPAEQRRDPSASSARVASPTSAVPAATAPAGMEYRVQLASYRTEGTAERGRGILLGMLGNRIDGLEVLVREDSGTTSGINYRVRSLPLADRGTAEQLCVAVIASGHPDCLVILHNSALWQPVVAVRTEEPARYRVQLASYRTEQGAARGHEVLSTLLGEQMHGFEILVKRAHTPASLSIDFAIRSVPLDSPGEAAALCEIVRAAGHPDCLVIQHGESVWQLAGERTEQSASSAIQGAGPAVDRPSGTETADTPTPPPSGP